jgi:hypothetical protein
VRWTEHVARIINARKAHKYLVEILMEINLLLYIDLDETEQV